MNDNIIISCIKKIVKVSVFIDWDMVAYRGIIWPVNNDISCSGVSVIVIVSAPSTTNNSTSFSVNDICTDSSTTHSKDIIVSQLYKSSVYLRMLQLFTEHNSSTESNEIGITTSNVSASIAPYFPSLSTINFCNGCIGVKMQSNSSLPFNGAYPCINLTFLFL